MKLKCEYCDKEFEKLNTRGKTNGQQKNPENFEGYST